MRKCTSQEGFEFIDFKFSLVKLVVTARKVGVDRLVGCRDDQDPVRGENPPSLAQKSTLMIFVEVLDHFETDHHIKRCNLKRQG